MNDFFKTLRSYLTVFLPKQRCCSHNTIHSYGNALGLFTRYLREERRLMLNEIDFSVVDRECICGFLVWLDVSRKSSSSTQNQRLMVLRSFFKYAGIVDCANISIQKELEKVPIKKSQKRIVEFLSEQALQTLLATPDTRTHVGRRNRFFMILMYDTAARCQELLDLKLQDVILTGRTPYLYLSGKGNKIRAVPLMDKTCAHYKQYLEAFHPAQSRQPDDYLFYTTIHGKRCQMSPDNVAIFMKACGEIATLGCPDMPKRVHPHQIRHTRAIHLYRGGMPLPLLSEFLGHADINTTNIYAYADTEMKRAALEKVTRPSAPADVMPIWENDEEMILKLCGIL